MSVTSVIITKDGLMEERWEDRKYVITAPTVPILALLRENVTIAPGVTLGDIFNVVESIPEIKEFISHYAICPWIDEFHAEAKRPAPEDDDTDRLVAVWISRTLEIHDSINDQRIESWVDCSGKAESGEIYGIDFCSVSKLAKLPVLMEQGCVVIRWTDGPCGGRDVTKDDTKKAWPISLLELLETIYYEISFHGGPQSRDERGAELRQMVQEIEDGTAELTPYEPLSEDKETIQ